MHGARGSVQLAGGPYRGAEEGGTRAIGVSAPPRGRTLGGSSGSKVPSLSIATPSGYGTFPRPGIGRGGPRREGREGEVPADWVRYMTRFDEATVDALVAFLPFPDLLALMCSCESLYHLFRLRVRELSLKTQALDFTDPRAGAVFARFNGTATQLNLTGAGIPTLPNAAAPVLNERMHLELPGAGPGTTPPPATCKELWDNFHRLERLDLSFFQGLTDRDVEWVSRYCRDLTFLTLVGCPLVTDGALQHIAAGFGKLEHLHLSIAYVRERSVRHLLATCTSLKSLHMPAYAFGEALFQEYQGRVQISFLYPGDTLFSILRQRLDTGQPIHPFHNALVLTHVGELHPETGALLRSQQVFDFGGQRVPAHVQNNLSPVLACILAREPELLRQLLQAKADPNLARPLLHLVHVLQTAPSCSSLAVAGAEAEGGRRGSDDAAQMLLEYLRRLHRLAPTLQVNHRVYASLSALQSLPFFPRHDDSWPRGGSFLVRPCHLLVGSVDATSMLRMEHGRDMWPLVRKGQPAALLPYLETAFPLSSMALAIQGPRYPTASLLLKFRQRSLSTAHILDLLCFTNWEVHCIPALKLLKQLCTAIHSVRRDVFHELAARRVHYVDSTELQAAFNSALDIVAQRLPPDYRLEEENAAGKGILQLALQHGNGPVYRYLEMRLAAMPPLRRDPVPSPLQPHPHLLSMLYCCARGELKLLRALLRPADRERDFDNRVEKLDLHPLCRELGIPVPLRFRLVHFATRSPEVVAFLMEGVPSSLRAKLALAPVGSGPRPMVQLYPQDVALLTRAPSVPLLAGLRAPCATLSLALWVEGSCWPACTDWRPVFTVLGALSRETLLSLNPLFTQVKSVLHLLYSAPVCRELMPHRTFFLDLLAVEDAGHLNLVDEGGKTLLHYCCERADFEMVEALLQRPDVLVNVRCHRLERTPLHVLAEEADCAAPQVLHCLDLLLRHPSALARRGIEEFSGTLTPDTDLMDAWGCTPLSISLYRDAIRCASALNHVTEDTATSPFTQALLGSGASLRTRHPKTKQTVFHTLPKHILRYGWIVDSKYLMQLIRLWWRYGILSLNALDAEGVTGYDVFATWFLECDVPESSFVGWSKREILVHLQQLGCRTHEGLASVDSQVHARRLFDAARRADLEEIRLVAMHNVPLTSDFQSKLPIHLLCMSRDRSFRNNMALVVECVSALLGRAEANRVDMNVMDLGLETPLSYALAGDAELEERVTGESPMVLGSAEPLPLSCLSAHLLRVGASMRGAIDEHSGRSILHLRLRRIVFEDGPHDHVDALAGPFLRTCARWVQHGRLDPNLQDQSACTALDLFADHVPPSRTKDYVLQALQGMGFRTSAQLLGEAEGEGGADLALGASSDDAAGNEEEEPLFQPAAGELDALLAEEEAQLAREQREEEEEVLEQGFALGKPREPPCLLAVQPFVRLGGRRGGRRDRVRIKLEQEPEDAHLARPHRGPPLCPRDRASRELLLAARHADDERIARLLDAGAEVAVGDDFTQTPLFLYVANALAQGREEMRLLPALLSPHTLQKRHPSGLTPLALALTIDVLRLSPSPAAGMPTVGVGLTLSPATHTLLVAGATCRVAKPSRTVWHGLAAGLGSPTSWLCKWLERVRPSIPLRLAPGVLDAEALCRLLRALQQYGGLDLNHKDDAGFSGLDVLVDRYVNLQLETMSTPFPALVAALQGMGCVAHVFAENVECLLGPRIPAPALLTPPPEEAGCAVEDGKEVASTYLALHAAAAAVDVDELRLLLHQGQRRELCNEHGQLALHVLCGREPGAPAAGRPIPEHAGVKAAYLLLGGRRGDINTFDGRQETPLSLSLRRDTEAMTKQLQGSLLCLSLRNREEEEEGTIAFQGPGGAGEAPLQPSLLSQFLLAQGGTLDAQAPHTGDTVLHGLCRRVCWAPGHGDPEAAIPFHLLLNTVRVWKEAGGLDVRHVNRHGCTALQVLDERSARGELGLSPSSYQLLRHLLLAFRLL